LRPVFEIKAEQAFTLIADGTSRKCDFRENAYVT
jgi:hypothetical protein